MVVLGLSTWWTPARAASFSVSNVNDSGPGSLRQALIDAAAPGADTITITATGTITLLSNLPAVTQSLTITGPVKLN